jgi:hypothetical protein
MAGVPEFRHAADISCGEMAEWLKAAVLKTAERETVPGVRIPLSPPAFAGSLTAELRLGRPAGHATPHDRAESEQ